MPTDDDKDTPKPPEGADGKGAKDDKPAGGEPKTDPPKKADGDGAGGGDGDKNIASQLAIFKKRAADAEAKVDKLEKAQLEKDGDLKGLLAKSEKRVSKLTDQLKEVKLTTLKAKLHSEFTKHAPDAQNLELLGAYCTDLHCAV